MFGNPLESTFYTPSLDNRIPSEDRFAFGFPVTSNVETLARGTLTFLDGRTVKPSPSYTR